MGFNAIYMDLIRDLHGNQMGFEGINAIYIIWDSYGILTGIIII
jgi:hypothetical protein